MKRILTTFLFCIIIIIAGSVCPPNTVQAQEPIYNSEPFESFLWIRSRDYQNKRYARTVMAFAERHDLTLVMPQYSGKNLDNFEGILQMAKERGIFVWVNTGWFLKRDGYTAKKLLNNLDVRANFISGITELTEVYSKYYPNGRVVLLHEEPRVSSWGGGVKKVIEHGPDIFKHEFQAVKSVNPNLEVGLFINPYDIKRVYPELTKGLEKYNVMPDFNFVDFYRGYRDPAHGIKTTNQQLKSQIKAARQHTNGRPVYYLGEAHTINNNYTPSKKAINETVAVAMDTDVKAIGWYIRTKYRKTSPELNNDLQPFLSNEGTVDTSQVTNTFTFSRDRLVYGVMKTLEQTRSQFEPSQKFDLWVTGKDFDFNEGGIYLKTEEGDWDFIGYYGTYVGGSNPYSLSDKYGTVIYHALDRSRYLTSEEDKSTLEIKIKTDKKSDGATLHKVQVMPYQPTDQYISAPEAGRLQTQNPEYVNSKSLGITTWRPDYFKLKADSVQTISF